MADNCSVVVASKGRRLATVSAVGNAAVGNFDDGFGIVSLGNLIMVRGHAFPVFGL